MTLIHGFDLLRDETIPEIQSRVRLWRHSRTGAELLSLENNDENKVFGITFRTPPPNSTGIAHIMEHSVLCGSRKYRVKEPFIELAKGSLNTFLNAFTYPDKTCYPVASTNLQDFYNLIDVYLDAVFFPLLDPYTLRQEGWHFELDSVDSEMTFKGVVFNEMKGAYSSADEILYQESLRALFPDTIYNLDSGGDPQVIPDLTYQAFKHFHEVYYHPSNARIFFYGDDDPQERLRLMDQFMESFAAIPIESHIPYQPRFSSPRQHQSAYDSGNDPDAKSQVTVNWLLPDNGDAELSLSFAVLNHILIGTSAAPLHKALIESGLGEDLAGHGFDSGLQQMIFSTGLKEVEEENSTKVETLILDTLTQLTEQGIDPETIAASMNTVEFVLRERNTGGFPRGLAMMLNALDFWLYGHDPLAPLAFERPLNELKERLSQGEPVFEKLLREQLLNNPHRVTLLLKPDPDLGTQRHQLEQERLATARSQMSTQEIQQVIADTVELKRRQEAPDLTDALATIPMLKRGDLEPRTRQIPLEVLNAGQSTILFHDLFTNGILYLDLGFNLHFLPDDLIPYIPLFSRAMLETGTAKLDFVRLQQRIGQHTGGIYPATFSSAVRGKDTGTSWLFLRAKAMVDQSGELLAIFDSVLRTARLNNRERIRQMVLENKASLESSIVNLGHRVINLRLRARYNEADWASEEMSGISQLFFLRRLVQKIDADWETVNKDLETIRSILLNQASLIANVTLDKTNWQMTHPQIETFLTALPANSTVLAKWQPSPVPENEALTLPSQVNFVSKGTNFYQNNYQLHGSALVINPHLGTTWLWDKIRVQGGAYGAFAVFDQHSGVFSFLSYRDPNLDRTLEMYDQTADYLRNLDLSESELTKAIIGAIGQVDAYQLPDAKGYTALTRHLLGVSDEERQRTRDEVLGATADDFHALGEVLAQMKERGSVAVLGSQQAVEASQISWVRIHRVL